MTRSLVAACALLTLGSIMRPAAARTDNLVADVSGSDTVRVAPPTGVRDTDRSSILAALAQVEPGGTIRFEPGTYRIGGLVRVSVPRVTLLGHSGGTTLLGCDFRELQEPGVARSECQIMLSGPAQTVRNLTFENMDVGLLIGIGTTGGTALPTTLAFDGGHQIEGNTFRSSVTGVRVMGRSSEPVVIRNNRFLNTYHAVIVNGMTVHVLENDISAPDLERIPRRPGSGAAIGITPIPAPGGGTSCTGNVIAGNRIDGHPNGIGIRAVDPGNRCWQNVIRNNTVAIREFRLDSADLRRFAGRPGATVMGVPIALRNMPEYCRAEAQCRPGFTVAATDAAAAVDDNLIEGNRIIGADGLGIEVLYASRNRIVNNRISRVAPKDPFPSVILGPLPAWRAFNGSGIWISRGSDENEIVGNTFVDVGTSAVVVEGRRNTVTTRNARDSVRDSGSGNRIRVASRAAQSDTGAIDRLTAHQATAQVTPRFGLRVPMRDGVELAADAYLPEQSPPAPVLLIRTPYMKDLDLLDVPGMARYFGGHGYALVIQDVRGRGDSDGDFDFFFADAEDGYDTIEWLARQPWSNGSVCMFGLSYMGTVQWLAAKERPPALKCLVSTAAVGRYFDEIPYRGGAFRAYWALDWVNGRSGRVEQSARTVDWERVLSHRPLLTADSVMGRKMKHYRDFLLNSISGPYWGRIALDQRDFRNIDLPALHITGSFEGDQPGALHYWRNMREYSPARDHQYLVMGPWNHIQTWGGATKIGELELTPDAVIDNRRLHLAFFDRYLKGTGNFDQPRARVYLTGSNVWRDYPQYPPPDVLITPLYLHSGGRANSRFGDGALSWSVPEEQQPDRYQYDPKRPAPDDGEVAGDRAAIQRRDDILVYSTVPLEERVEIVGPVFLELHAASDARDTDFTATLLDVFPDGRAVTLSHGIIRARYRNGYDREELLTAGSIEKYRIELNEVAHSFGPGHRIRVEVSSSFAPSYTPNQNTGNPVATDTEWRIANQTVYHDARRLSAILLPVLRSERASSR